MASLREIQRQKAAHWRLLTFRQEIKKRLTPSQSFNLTGISLKEKRLRIIETMKSSSDPKPFVVPSVDFCAEEIMRQSEKKDVYKLLTFLVRDSAEMFNLVDQQSKLEQQLYIQKLVRYNSSHFYCHFCLEHKSYLVSYTELIPSNVNGDDNMDRILSYDVKDFIIRDEKLVWYLFYMLQSLR